MESKAHVQHVLKTTKPDKPPRAKNPNVHLGHEVAKSYKKYLRRECLGGYIY